MIFDLRDLSHWIRTEILHLTIFLKYFLEDFCVRRKRLGINLEIIESDDFQVFQTKIEKLFCGHIRNRPARISFIPT